MFSLCFVIVWSLSNFIVVLMGHDLSVQVSVLIDHMNILTCL